MKDLGQKCVADVKGRLQSLLAGVTTLEDCNTVVSDHCADCLGEEANARECIEETDIANLIKEVVAELAPQIQVVLVISFHFFFLLVFF